MTRAFDLTGRVAIVTGGNGGIGLGMARGLAEAGASLMIAARNPQKTAAALAELQELSPQVAAVEMDVLDRASITRMVEAAVTRFGRLDILIANAGSNIRKPPEEYTADEWSNIVDVNLRGTFWCAQAAHPHLKRAGGGKIITIGSMTSIFGASFAAPYSASKGGTVQLSKALASAWAKDNIQVNAVLPGWIDTELTVGARRDVSGLEARVVARTPMGRWGKPKDLAGIAVFLASPASDFVTGTAIPVDGGYSAQG